MTSGRLKITVRKYVRKNQGNITATNKIEICKVYPVEPLIYTVYGSRGRLLQ